jgi:hypothetical protein
MIKKDFESLREELRNDLETKDWRKAVIVLSHFGQLDGSRQKLVLLDLSRGDADFVLPLLITFATSHPQIYEQQPMLRGMLISKAIDYPELLIKAMSALETKNKILCVEILGEMRCEQAVGYLLEMLTSTGEPELLKALIDTLGLIGVSEGVSPISDFLYVDNRDLVLAAVRALGRIAVPSAMFRLAERVGGDQELDRLILEVFS